MATTRCASRADRIQLRQTVEPRVEEALQLVFLPGEPVRKARELAPCRTDMLDGLDAALTDPALGLGKNVSDNHSDHVAHKRPLALLGRDPRAPPIASHSGSREVRRVPRFSAARAQAVVDVVVIVRNVVRDRRHLRLETRPAVELQIPLGVRFRQSPARFPDRSVMLGQSL